MRNLKSCLFVGAAAIIGLTGCESYHSRASGDRTEGRMVDDHHISAQVRADLRDEPVYKFGDVDVKTFNGVVQLSGFVNTDEQKRRAGEIAQSVPGVAQVQNAIALKPENPSPTGRGQGYNRNQGYNNNYNERNYGTNNPNSR